MTKERDIPKMRGTMTALVTPFCAQTGEIDWPRLDTLVDRQADGGIDWLVPCGTTGESPTLGKEERERILASVITRSAGRCRTMAGTGTNDTAETIRRTQQAQSMGADAALIVTPYYNRPTGEGLFRHFAAVAESVDLPIVLYDVPVRTGVHLDTNVAVKLRQRFPHIVALKHATGRVDGITELLDQCDIAVLSGDDALTWPLMSLGATGVISVVSNLCPPLMVSLVNQALACDVAGAQTIHRKVIALAEGLAGFGPNPVPIKAAMAQAGLIDLAFRLPLCPPDAPTLNRLAEFLRQQDCLEPLAV